MINITKRIIATYAEQAVIEYTLINRQSGFIVSIQNYGGVISQIITPDKFGVFKNVVIANNEFDAVNKFHLGAITGQVAGRIKDGKFNLNNIDYQLAINNGVNHIHGGIKGFNQQFWQVAEIINGVELSYTSIEMNEGYPANSKFIITYCIVDDYSLEIKYTLKSDSDTIANITNHSYFDLTCGNNPMSMEVVLPADYFAPIDNDGCVMNYLSSVDNSVFDLRKPTILQDILNSKHKQILLANGGLDHSYLLTNNAIKLTDNLSGRYLDIITDAPCCVVYTSNWLEPQRQIAVCFETQKMPNAINWPEFRDSVIISANYEYVSSTLWKFGVNK